MVTSMLEKAIEIEGLLRIIRDGHPLPETYKLLNIKTSQLSVEAASLLGTVHGPEQTPPHADFVMSPAPTVHPAPAASDTSATATSLPAGQPDITISSTDLTAEEDLALAEEDDILLSFDDVPDNYTTEGNTQAEETATGVMPVGEETTISGNATPSSPQPSTSSTSAAASEPPAQSASAGAKKDIKLKSAFSLNDRFLYARELFNGNMKIFDSTLEFIQGIEEYSMVEDYFYSELEWSPEHPHVAAFMDIIRPHFKE